MWKWMFLYACEHQTINYTSCFYFWFVFSLRIIAFLFQFQWAFCEWRLIIIIIYLFKVLTDWLTAVACVWTRATPPASKWKEHKTIIIFLLALCAICICRFIWFPPRILITLIRTKLRSRNYGNNVIRIIQEQKVFTYSHLLYTFISSNPKCTVLTVRSSKL